LETRWENKKGFKGSRVQGMVAPSFNEGDAVRRQ
jgi:hypothetical protein